VVLLIYDADCIKAIIVGKCATVVKFFFFRIDSKCANSLSFICPSRMYLSKSNSFEVSEVPGGDIVCRKRVTRKKG
jgi:hypothetical protein